MAKQAHRYRRNRKGDGLIEEWPSDAPTPEALARKVRYDGSAEHKVRPVHSTFDIEPALRSDASKCAQTISRSEAQRVLRKAIRRRFVSKAWDGDFPRYVWGWVDGKPHVARLTNRTRGAYKGWPIEEFELPTDRHNVLDPTM